MANIPVKVVVRIILTQLHDQCFRRWEAGGPMRLGPTLREHCVRYFTANELTRAFLDQVIQRDPASGETVRKLYENVLLGTKQIFERYSDAQAQSALDEWKQNRGCLHA